VELAKKSEEVKRLIVGSTMTSEEKTLVLSVFIEMQNELLSYINTGLQRSYELALDAIEATKRATRGD